MKKLVLILLLSIILPSTVSAAMFDPAFKFQVIETEHFKIYYHQGLGDIAKRAASTAEEVHQKLSRLLKWRPEELTNIVIADNSDFANGMTTVVPYNVIYLQTAPPSVYSTIGEYDNWLRLLIVHEYAHLLTSDPVRGYSRVMRSIFGKVVPLADLLNLLAFVATGPPNMLMPRWWHEGMATWAETELTSVGRGRSSYYQMLYRTAVKENNLLSIDKINGDIPYWPGGNSPYIFGSALIQYIAEKYGNETPGKISLEQSSRFPYFINAPPENQTGVQGYQDLYAVMLTSMAAEQTSKIKILEKEPFTHTTRLGRKAVAETNPRYSRDGAMLAFNRNDRHSHPVIIVRDKGGKEIRSVEREYGDGNISWLPDNSAIIYSQALLSVRGNYYQDIYRYDLKRERVKRLTSGARASEPDMSPDGTTIAAVINSLGSQNIGLFDYKALLDGNKRLAPKMVTSFRESRVSSPRWSPDSKSLVFALTDSRGRSSLNLLQVENASIKEISKNGHTIVSSTWAPDGKNILYSSDLSGVYNIYRFNLETAETEQLTHLLSGGFSPDISAADRTMAIDEYSSHGSTIAVIPEKELRRSTLFSPSIKNNLYPVSPLLLEPSVTAAEQPRSDPAPYSPLPSLLPKFWLPTIAPETAKDQAFGVMTAGQDLLGYHTYYGRIMYGTGFKETYFDALYQYNRLIPTFTLHGYGLPATYTNLLRSGDYTEIQRGLIASVSAPLLSLESGLSVNAGYHLRDTRHLTEGSPTTFNGKQVYEGRRDSYFAGFDFITAQKYPWSITAEEGRNISFQFEYFGKASGSELETREYTASWEEFTPITGHHNLMTRITGGLADGDQAAQQSFQLGGIPSFLNRFGIRGYKSFYATGDRIATGTVEYRFPIRYFMAGPGTKPIFTDRLHGALFVDAGEVWSRDRAFRGADIMVGAGTEVRLDLTIGYWLKITPAIGYAHGFDKPYGTDQIYFNIYANL